MYPKHIRHSVGLPRGSFVKPFDNSSLAQLVKPFDKLIDEHQDKGRHSGRPWLVAMACQSTMNPSSRMRSTGIRTAVPPSIGLTYT